MESILVFFIESQEEVLFFFFFSSRRRHTRCSRDWSSDVCSSDLNSCFQRLARRQLPGKFHDLRSAAIGYEHDGDREEVRDRQFVKNTSQNKIRNLSIS